MKITPEIVRHVAELARLDLTGEERVRLMSQMGDILGYIGLLDTLALENVTPTAHSIDLANVLREDVVRPSLPVEKGLANAPEKEGSAFKVPRIIED